MKIAVLGERFIDRYFVGTSTRTSPEVPTLPVVKIDEQFDLPGGAGNVSANLKALGVTVVSYYQPGPFPIKNRLISGGVQVARWDQDDSCAGITKQQAFYLKQDLARGDVDGLIISDYGKGMFSDLSVLKGVIPSGLAVYIDTKQNPETFLPLTTDIHFFPNIIERLQWEHQYTTIETTYRALVIQKKGKDGIYFQGTTYPSLTKEINSVSGAGDTVVAAFAVKDLSMYPEAMTIQFAQAAAAVVCEKPYTATASFGEISARLNSI